MKYRDFEISFESILAIVFGVFFIFMVIGNVVMEVLGKCP